MAAVAFDEGLVVVGDAEVAGVEEDRVPVELRRPVERRGARRDLDRRGVAFEDDPSGLDADREQPLPLVLSQDLEAVHPAAQRHGPAIEEPEERRYSPAIALHLGHQALGVEIGDAVGEPLAEQEIQRDEDLDQERGAAGEQDLVRRAQP
ncbi:MAG: hypothetical protein DMF53_25030 [Acidobacteria bacterium]|nr:MAG: hypothetical protein DMF53_25030 [Acidobacteriota bacterium]